MADEPIVTGDNPETKDPTPDKEEDKKGKTGDQELPVRKTMSRVGYDLRHKKKELRDIEGPDDDEEPDLEDPELQKQVKDVAGEVRKEARKILQPIAESIEESIDKSRDEIEVNAFLSDPKNLQRYGKHRAEAMRHLAHPAYANVPVDRIFKMLGADDAVSEQETARNRDQAIRRSAGGNTYRSAPESDLEKIANAKFGTKEFQEIRTRIAAGETIDLSEYAEE